jgi:hypothetical protein
MEDRQMSGDQNSTPDPGGGMQRWLKIDEFRLELFVPAGRTQRGLRVALADKKLPARLRTAARRVLVRAVALEAVRVKVSR